jgi:CPA2 family monovalent cation:H+ antiporter-2
MHAAFLQDLAVVMIVAAVVTILFHRLKQPVVLGYILAGVIVGPHNSIPLSVHDEHAIAVMSELGVILLMFSLGLHFSLRKLAAVGATAFLAASFEILAMLLIGYGIGRAFGWGRMDSLFLGAILSISSTTIIIKALAELGRSREKFAQLIFGILIVEDILAIAMLALLSGIATTGTMSAGHVLLTLGKLGVFLTVVLVIGLLTVPALLRYVARFRSDEMMLITSLGVCFGVSLLALQLEYSVALGAFLSGAIIAEARESGKVHVLIEPVRDMFSAVFFVAIGMMIDPKLILQYAWPITVITAAVVIGKVMTCSSGTFLAGHGIKDSLRVGMAVSQIGEFSFIIAQLGLTLKVTSEFLYPLAVAVSAITTLLTPYLIKVSDPLAEAFERRAPSRLVSHLHVYTEWAAKLGTSARGDNRIRALLRRGILQIGLNLVLITGLLIAASAAARHVPAWVPALPQRSGGRNAIVWLAAVVLAMPLLIATIRKLRALAMVLAELNVTREGNEAMRAIVANTILIAGTSMIVLWVLLISSALLPPWPVMLALLFVIALVTLLMWRAFVRVYAKAQITLQEVMAQIPAAHETHAPPPLPAMLRDAVLETIKLDENAPAKGKLIRELQLRTSTGASVVAIERDGERIINPSPDEELRAGDDVLLLGTSEQLDAAQHKLRRETSSPRSA